MARIRSIHPGIMTDEAWVTASPIARWLAMGILMECDDQGAFEWKPVTLKMRCLPADNVDVPTLLEELTTLDIIAAYTVGGRQYGAVRNFGKFQSPKKPRPVHPMPPEWRTYAASGDPSSEPDGDEGGSGSPPSPPQPPPVPPKAEPASSQAASVPPNEEIARQMDREREKEREKEEEPPPSLRSVRPPPPESRGSRLPDDWQPSDADAELARSMHLDPRAIANNFRDFWHAKAGKDARKASWSATWRVWCRREAERRPSPRATPGRSSAAWMAAELGLGLPPLDDGVTIDGELVH